LTVSGDPFQGFLAEIDLAIAYSTDLQRRQVLLRRFMVRNALTRSKSSMAIHALRLAAAAR
jgi:hypothetical protein